MSCAGWDGPVADRGRGQHTCGCGDGQRGHERVASHTTARWHLDGHRWKEGELVADGTPDTSLAVVVFGELLVCEETEEAATAARRISVTAAERVRELAVSLWSNGVELTVDVGGDAIEVPPEWSMQGVEHFDAKREVPTVPLPLDLTDVVGGHLPELVPQEVLVRPAVIGDRGRAVGLAPCPSGDRSSRTPHRRALIADALDGSSGCGLRREVVGAGPCGGAPGEDLAAVLGDRLLPLHAAVNRIPAPAAAGWLAPGSAGPSPSESEAPLRVSHVAPCSVMPEEGLEPPTRGL
jgi:hypothetical protein